MTESQYKMDDSLQNDEKSGQKGTFIGQNAQDVNSYGVSQGADFDDFGKENHQGPRKQEKIVLSDDKEVLFDADVYLLSTYQICKQIFSKCRQAGLDINTIKESLKSIVRQNTEISGTGNGVRNIVGNILDKCESIFNVVKSTHLNLDTLRNQQATIINQNTQIVEQLRKITSTLDDMETRSIGRDIDSMQLGTEIRNLVQYGSSINPSYLPEPHKRVFLSAEQAQQVLAEQKMMNQATHETQQPSGVSQLSNGICNDPNTPYELW